MNLQSKKFITIGSPDSRRVQFWDAVLQPAYRTGRQYNCEHQVITYQQIIKDDFPIITEPTTIRLTSTGEDFELEKTLMGMGGYSDAHLLSFEKGLIYPNDFWYKGFCILLKKIENFTLENPLIKTINSPTAIQLAFHKLKCQQFLSQKNISTPKIILDQVIDYDSLIEKMETENIRQVFIKPYHGSSASGVMALRQSKGRQMLYTTIHLQNGKMYNHLKLQKYHSLSEIKTIINKMIPSGLLVEEWIRKKTFQEKSVDFRILVINGKAAFTVPRMSNHFITNLHLGNEKGNFEEIEKEWGSNILKKAKDIAVQAVHEIGGLFYAGVDVAISQKGKPYILEVNAFGDMLLNVFQDGMNTYEYELKEWINLI